MRRRPLSPAVSRPALWPPGRRYAAGTAGSPGQAPCLTHGVGKLIGVEVVAGFDGGLALLVGGQQRRIGENRDCVLKRVEVVGGQKYRGAASVAGDLEALMGGRRLVDQFGQM